MQMEAITSRKPDRFTALAGSALFHALLAGIFFATMVDLPKTYDDPGGEGIVLNYGVDAEGSGDVQTTAAANPSTNTEDSAPSNEDPQPQPETSAEPQPEPDPAPEAQPTVTSDVEETVAVPVTEKPKKEEVRKEKDLPKPTPPKPVVNPSTVYNPNKGGNGTAGTSSNATGNNNGDRPGKVGDQGDPEGSLNSKALYGVKGSGTGGTGGGSLQMVGWTWEQAPNVRDASSESGKIVFEVKVDETGEVQSVNVVSSTVGPAVQQSYRDALFETSFVRTQSAAGGSNKGAIGRVTFILRAR